MQLKRAGSRYVALCPFHNEKTPSFSVDPDRGFWYCFGCKQGGDVFKFLMQIEGMGFPEAVQKLADETGVEIKREEGDTQADTARRRSLELMNRVCEYYSHVLFGLPEGAAGRAYLQKRRISKALAEKFRLGFAPVSSSGFFKVLHDAGFTDEEAETCGVLVRGRFGERELLSGRLIFPICDFQGRVIAMGGRSLGNELPKYVNSPETPLYSKRKHLYGLNVARGQISRSDLAIVTEGYFDVISMHQAGFGSCVASLGTALTPEQARLLKRYASQAVLAYDGDNAGANAIIKGNAVLEEAGMQVTAVKFPEGEDPDSLALKGHEAVQSLLDSRAGIVQFQIDRKLKEIDVSKPEGKETFLKEILPFIERIKDEVRRDAYVRELAYCTGYAENKIYRLLHRPVQRERLAAAVESRMLNAEERLLSICSSHPEWIKEIKSVLPADAVSDKQLSPIFLRFWDEFSNRTEPIKIDEAAAGCAAEVRARLTEIMANDRIPSSVEDAVKLAVSIRDENWKNRLDSLRITVVQAINNGTMQAGDPLYAEYERLKQYFHSNGGNTGKRR